MASRRLVTLGVPATTGARQTYLQKLQTYTLTGLYALSETSGATAADSSGNARNANAVAVVWANDSTFPDGTPAPYFDGASAYVSCPAGLIAAVNASAGSMAVWMKVADWTATGTIMIMFGDANDFVEILQSPTDNRLTARHDGNGTLVGRDVSGLSATGWIHLGMVWSVAGNYLRCYYNGAKVGADVTGLAAVGQATTQITIGARTAAPLTPFKGHLKYAIFSNELWTDADVADLYVVPPGN